MTRGMSSATMSHAPMRAAPALSALAETRRDEPREVIETACRIRFAHLLDGELARLGEHRGGFWAADTDATVPRGCGGGRAGGRGRRGLESRAWAKTGGMGRGGVLLWGVFSSPSLYPGGSPLILEFSHRIF